MFKRRFVRQESVKDCGAACLLMIMRHYGGNYPLEKLREMMNINKNGTSALNLIEAARKVGFDARGYKCPEYKELKYPSIAHVIIDKAYHHFVVVEKVDIKHQIVTVADPALGLKKYSFTEFDQIWTHIIMTFYPIRKIDNINTIKSVRKTIYQMINPYKKLFVLIFILSIIYTAFNIINTFYFKIVIDHTTLSTATYLYLFLFFMLISIIKIIIDFIRNELLIYINKRIDKSLMEDTFKHLLSLPWQYFNSRTTGDIVSRLNDLSYVRELISRSSIILLVDLVLVIGSMIVMWFINYKLFLIIILIFFVYFIIVYLFNRSIKCFIIENQESEALVSSNLVETISGISTVKNLSIENQVYDKAMKKYNDLVNNNYHFNRRYNLVRTLKDFVAGGGLLTIIFLGGIFISQGSLSIGSFILFYFFLNFFLEPMKNIFDAEPLLRASSNALIRISEFYNIEKDKVGGLSKLQRGNITLNNLTFAYNGRDKVVSDLSLEICNGEKIMINGPSGSGKSTIAKILMRYFDIQPKQIMVDGKDVLDYSLATIRNNICYVSQDEMIFTDSLYNNIVLDRNVKDNNFRHILDITHINDIFIKRNLDHHMLLEENGTNLSGGERQRIMIARALLKDSRVFIFDESMSEMNASLERAILKNIFANYNDKTIIVISHRLDNADLYDKVITIDDMKKTKKKGAII
ncbi:MAG: peptidase domain-containing ABC transporter [Bacilli bacterium]|nr:peptidase domain-containing ABC transporter [Bacilli bacterium]